MAPKQINTGNSKAYYRISEISRMSGVPSQTIHYYVREGLLPPPVKTSKTMAYYSEDHLERLYFIKKQQIESNQRLKQIKQQLAVDLPAAAPDDQEDKEGPVPFAQQKETILETAINLFTQKGYAETSITDIVNTAGVGRGTYYQLFKNKEDLLLECADRVFYELYSHVWEKLKNETDMMKRLQIRFEEYIKSYPKWRDMMDIIKSLASANNKKGIQKHREILQQITQPIVREIDRAARQQAIPNPDITISTVGAYMLLGASDYCARLHHEQGYDINLLFDHINQLIFKGLRYTPQNRSK